MVDRQPESTWRAAAGSAYPAHHPVLAASCVRSWLRLQHRVDANIAGGRCTRLKLQREAGCLVELDSRLVYLSLVEEAGARPLLRVSELVSTHMKEWPLPSSHDYCPLTRVQQYNNVAGLLALPYGGPWEQRQQAAAEAGVVILHLTAGTCCTVPLPAQAPRIGADFMGWAGRPEPWVAIEHVPVGWPITPLLWACSARGAVYSLALPWVEQDAASTSVADLAPSGHTVALASNCLSRGFSAGIWLWTLGDMARHITLVSSMSRSSPIHSCAFSPCSTMLLCHTGSCVEVLDVQSLEIVQHIPFVPGPAALCVWALTSAAVLVEACQPQAICSGVQLLQCCSSGLQVGTYLTSAVNKLHLGTCAWSYGGQHLAAVTGTARYGKLVSDFELVIIKFASAKAEHHHLDWAPGHLDWTLQDSAVVLSDQAGQRHLVLSFK